MPNMCFKRHTYSNVWHGCLPTYMYTYIYMYVCMYVHNMCMYVHVGMSAYKQTCVCLPIYMPKYIH